ncbi:MAG TPA: anion permease, partial [Burkholderiales bacterium]
MPNSASTRIASITPFAVAIVVALIPAPGGLPQHAWYFFSIFAGVIAGLVLEPLPCPAVGLIGATVVAVLAKWALFSPAELAKPGFNATNAAINWALAGFA